MAERWGGRGGRRQGAMACVLFADLVGSTALMAALGDDAFDDLRETHSASLRKALGTYGGTEIKGTGDGIMATCPSAVDAVACAVAMRHLTARQAQTGSAALAIRVGLSLARSPSRRATSTACRWWRRPAPGCGRGRPDPGHRTGPSRGRQSVGSRFRRPRVSSARGPDRSGGCLRGGVGAASRSQVCRNSRQWTAHQGTPPWHRRRCVDLP